MAETTTMVHPYTPDLVYPPGDTLAEVLEEAGMTQAELALRTGLSTKHVNQIVNGQAAITPDTALLLERATGVRARIWSNLEVAYREYLSQREEEKRLAGDVAWLDAFPVAELIRRGWIRKRDNAAQRVRDLCQFFGVANRSSWEAVWQKPTAYRTSKAFTSDPGAVAAWLRIGEIRAARVKCAAFDKQGLQGALEDLRALTNDDDPESWGPRLVDLCRSVGVAVVVEREIKGARINGAARWLSPDKALVQLSLRYRSNDIFWFTFFHELAHLLLHSKKDTFINDEGAHSGVEQESDAFASQALIPRRYEAELGGLSTPQEVKKFAQRLQIAPGIVVGRLQYDRRWPYSHGNDLKVRFDPEAVESAVCS